MLLQCKMLFFLILYNLLPYEVYKNIPEKLSGFTNQENYSSNNI